MANVDPDPAQLNPCGPGSRALVAIKCNLCKGDIWLPKSIHWKHDLRFRLANKQVKNLKRLENNPSFLREGGGREEIL